ncbi:MAG: hypothetical protein WBV73_10985 [Phormidium sp.]
MGIYILILAMVRSHIQLTQFYLVMADREKAIATAFTFSSLNFGYDCSILEKLNSSEPVNSVTLPNT